MGRRARHQPWGLWPTHVGEGGRAEAPREFGPGSFRWYQKLISHHSPPQGSMRSGTVFLWCLARAQDLRSLQGLKPKEPGSRAQKLFYAGPWIHR